MSSKFNTTFQKRPFKITYHEADTVPPPAATASVLGAALTGDMNKVMTEVINNKGALGARNESGKTVLHLLIDNKNLSQNELYNLVTRAADNGAPIDTSDDEGVRPLHLAARRQNKSVVEYLLSKGADPLAASNAKLTALHYAIIPETVNCDVRAVEEVEKKEQIVDPPKKQIRKTVHDFQDHVLSRIKDSSLTMYLLHLGKMAAEMKLIPTKDDDKAEALKILREAASESRVGTTGDKLRDSVKYKIKPLRDRIYQRALADFNTGLESVDFKHDKDKSWGPNNDPDLRILHNFTGPKMWYTQLKQKTNKSIESAIAQSLNKTDVMTSNLEELSLELNKVKAFFGSLWDMIGYEMNDTGLAYDPFDQANDPHVKVFLHQDATGNIQADLMNEFDQKIIIGQNNSMFDTGDDHSVFPISITSTNPIDLNADDGAGTLLYPPYERNDFLDQPVNGPGNPSPRSKSDAMRYYIQKYEELVEELQDQIRTFKTNYNDNTDLGERVDELANIQKTLTTMLYGTFLMSIVAEELLDGIMEVIQEVGDRDAFKELIRRINSIVDEKEIAKQIKANKDVYKVKNYDPTARNSFVTNKDFKLIMKIEGSVSSNIFDSYYLLKDLRTDQIMLVHFDFLGDTQDMAGNQLEFMNRFTGPGQPAIPYDFNQDPGALYSVLPSQTIPGEFDIYRITAVPAPVVVQGSITELIDKTKEKAGRFLKVAREQISGLSKDLQSVIRNFNIVQGVEAIRLFHSDMVINAFRLDQTVNPFQYVLDAAIPDNPILPSTIDRIHELIGVQIGRRLQAAPGGSEEYTRADLNPTHILIANEYLYKLKENHPVNILGNAVNAYTEGIRPDIGIPGIVPGDLGGQVSDTDKQDITHSILNVVMGEHLQIIRIYTIMDILSTLHDEYDNNDDTVYDRYVQMIEESNPTITEQPALIDAGEIVDKVVTSTYENLIKTATNLYVWKLVFPNTAFNPADTVLTRMFGLFDYQESLINLPVDDRNELTDQITENLGQIMQRREIAMLSKPFVKFEQSVGEQIRRMVNPDKIGDLDDICYKMDEDVVQALLDGGSDSNAQDTDLKTPLAYAVDLQNLNLIEKLIQRGASPNPSMYRVAFDNLVTIIRRAPMFNLKDIDTRVREHMMQKFKINVIPAKSTAILGMALYMLDHQLTLWANRYPNMYDVNTHDLIIRIIGMPKFDSFDLPLARSQNLDSIVGSTAMGNASYRDTVEILNQKIQRLEAELFSLENQIINIRRERDEYGPARQEGHDINRLIQDLKNTANDRREDIADVVRERDDVQRMIDYPPGAVRRQIREVMDRIDDPLINTLKYKNRFNVASIYRKFFKDELSGGRIEDSTFYYITYFELWEDCLRRASRNPKEDFTQMVRTVQTHLLQNADTIRQNPDQFVDLYVPLSGLYSKVWARYGEDYFDMSMYLTDTFENYALKQIYDIMFHVFRHTISVDIINATTGFVARLMSGNQDQYRIAVSNTFETLRASGFIESCLNDLPRKVIKTVCKMAEGENDPDVGLNVSDILNEALDLIDLSYYKALKNEEIKRLKSQISSYYSEYAKAYTAEMHSVLVKQLKSLMNQSRQLQILEELAKTRLRS